MTKFTFDSHPRQYKTFKYVYPVLSRRSQGLSIGINLNPNKACNWRCIYCQVENLVRGKPPLIEVDVLEKELDALLNISLNTDFIQKEFESDFRKLSDISLSGDGEPTLSKQFKQVIDVISNLRKKYDLSDQIKTVLITNGSEIEREDVLLGIKKLSALNGEIWFKVDAARIQDILSINQVNLSLESVAKRLKLANNNCKTFIQTCIFKIADINPSPEFITAYVNFLNKYKSDYAGVLLYSLARPPMLLEGAMLASVDIEFLKDLAQKISANGINVKYYL